MWICIDECVIQFSVITKKWSSNSISLKDLLIGIVVMWFWFEHQIYFNLAEEWIKDLWNRITMNLWLWACLEILCSSHSTCVLCLRRFVAEVLRGFGGWIRRVSPICGLLRFLEAFELDSSNLWDLGRWFGWFLFECSSYLKVRGGSSSGLWRLESIELHQFMVCWGFWRLFELGSNDLWDLGRWFGWFLFECSSYSKLKFLKFLEASRLGSNRVSGLLNLGLLQLSLGSP